MPNSQYKKPSKALISVILMCLFSAQLWAQTLQILYIQRPPLAYDNKTALSGILVDMMAVVGRTANLTLAYQDVKEFPLGFKLLNSNINACFLGSYKTPEREKKYKYSIPLYREEPYIAVANKSVSSSLGDKVSLEQLISSEFILGVQHGFSYGKTIDQLITEKSVPPIYLSYMLKKGAEHDERHVFSLINSERIDYLFLNAEEFWWNYTNGVTTKENITPIEITNPQQGIDRYLMCSKAVSDEVILSVNRGIEQLWKSPQYQIIKTAYQVNY